MSEAFKKGIEWDIISLANYVSEIVSKESGNILGPAQQSMVTSRLKKRMMTLGCSTPEDYYSYLTKNYNKESSHLISMLTTHHTYFFREFSHFEYLLKNIDSIVANAKKRGDSTIRILSAACSRGQEVYSLGMFFNHHLKNYPGMRFEIIGTDIDPESVKIAKNGVYRYREIKSIPTVYLTGNWMRGSGEISKFAKVNANIKDNCQFGVMNLLSPEKFLGSKKFDVIFCRNVFIYFDQKSIENIVVNFKKYLHKDALFVTGISESLKGTSLKVQTLAPSVYCLDPSVPAKTERTLSLVKDGGTPITRTTSRPSSILSSIPKPIRMLIVDDSSSVVKLLTKIFEKDEDFEVVGTAANGVEAQEFLRSNKVDAMTLDIHMPEMDGVEYLKKNYRMGHPNVIVVSSASREDTRYAQETLNNGACDFVEKPALNNLSERAEEIKNKIKMSFLNSGTAMTRIDRSFQKSFDIKSPDTKARFFVGSFSDKKKIVATLDELRGNQPPIFLFFEGNGNFLEMISEEFKSVPNVEVFSQLTTVVNNAVYICDFKNHFAAVNSKTSSRKKSLSVFGIVSKQVENSFFDLKNTQILIEDTESINESVKEVASDIFPWTSFAHLGTEYLADDE
ncbi:CheR family methyltransferase [Halobacteriovorax sp. CON-3]|uniref:CheR family methyltransferase n=1 Tax=Halobacteriovorax sp. CON-3 TaxID=3157710 RepID=UPI003714CB5E